MSRGEHSVGHATGSGRGRRAGLTREVLAREALALLDDVGLERFSMRSLAERLGVSAMALYNHVTSRDDLLGLVADRLGEEMATAQAVALTGLQRVRHVARSIRSAYLAHPAAIVVIQTTSSTSTASLAPIEQALSGFIESGMAPAQARSAWVGVIGLVTGHVSYQLQGHFSKPVAATSLPAGLVHLRSVVELGPLPYDHAFEESLTAYLDGLPRPAPGP